MPNICCYLNFAIPRLDFFLPLETSQTVHWYHVWCCVCSEPCQVQLCVVYVCPSTLCTTTDTASIALCRPVVVTISPLPPKRWDEIDTSQTEQFAYQGVWLGIWESHDISSTTALIFRPLQSRRVLKTMGNLEMSRNLLILENSGKSQWILNFLREICDGITNDDCVTV